MDEQSPERRPEITPGLRIGDAEREAAAKALVEHYTAGRLDHAEFDTRLELVYEAKVEADLPPLFADLPAPGPGATGPAPAAAAPQQPAQALRPVRPAPRPARGHGFGATPYPGAPLLPPVPWTGGAYPTPYGHPRPYPVRPPQRRNGSGIVPALLLAAVILTIATDGAAVFLFPFLFIGLAVFGSVRRASH